MVNEMTMLRALNTIAFSLLACSLAFSGYTLVDYLVAHNEFRFGTEVAGWRYQTKWHYVGSAAGEGLLALIGIVGGYFMTAQKARAILLLGAISALVVAHAA